jgi:hypothetical protein
MTRGSYQTDPRRRESQGFPTPHRAAMVASHWRPLQRGSMRGFFALWLRRWIGLPSVGQMDSNGRFRLVGGKRVYTAMVRIPDQATRERFMGQALAASDRLLAEDESA